MFKDPLLKKALGLVRRGKYREAVALLEAEVFRYENSFPYYYLLGLACLYAGDYGGAFTYFNRARNVKFREKGPLLGLAYCFLRRGDTEKAVDLYLDAQELDSGCARSRRALNLIRKYGADESLSARTQGNAARCLFPSIPGGRFSRTRLFIPAAVLLCAALLAGGVWHFSDGRIRLRRPGLENVVLAAEEKKDPVETEPSGVYRYIFTREQALSCYDEARKYFNEYRDEKAKYFLNRILESNASAAVRNKAALLKSYTAVPGFGALKDRFTYAEVAKEPWLYRDCYVIWKGSAANLVLGENTVFFDLLVGYDTRTVMEGTVRVEMAFPAELRGELVLEVLGKVVIPPGTDKFTLEATGIHQSPAR